VASDNRMASQRVVS